MLENKFNFSLILLLNILTQGIFGSFQVVDNLECSGDSHYSSGTEINAPSQCGTKCISDPDCKAFVYCTAKGPVPCAENCFYYSHYCDSTKPKPGHKLFRKKIHGGWSGWSSWSECSVNCGGGTRSRSRSCINPVPQYGGSNCHGSSTEDDYCNVNPCPIDGDWTSWATWSACPVTCGDGVTERSRSCTNPAPQYGGNTCAGKETENKLCAMPYCPVTILQAEFVKGSTILDESITSFRIKCAAICSATRSCVSFSFDSDGNCITKETNDDEGYNIV